MSSKTDLIMSIISYSDEVLGTEGNLFDEMKQGKSMDNANQHKRRFRIHTENILSQTEDVVYLENM